MALLREGVSVLERYIGFSIWGLPYADLSVSGKRYVSCAWWNAAIGNLNSFVICRAQINPRDVARSEVVEYAP